MKVSALALVCVLGLNPVWAEEARIAEIDGVYKLCREVEGFSGEVLELDHGNYRYWFYSDVGGDVEVFPKVGKYTRKGDVLSFEAPDNEISDRIASSLNGMAVLWTSDGLKGWQERGRIHPYAVLIRVDEQKVDEPWAGRPSIRSLYNQEMLKREEDEYQNRYNDLSEPLRSLLRADTLRGDSDLSTLKAEILKFRSNMDARVIGQLVSRMGYDEGVESIRAENILERIYRADWLIEEHPPYLRSAESCRKALHMLVDAMGHAKDRKALQDTLILFLRVSHVDEIDLPIPEAGVHMRLQVLGDKGYSDASGSIKGGAQPKDYRWHDEISIVNQECQKWCRARVERIRMDPSHIAGWLFRD